MLEGARSDRAAVAPQGLTVQVFDEAIALLETVHAQNRMAGIA
jgi:hypothetical protein